MVGIAGGFTRTCDVGDVIVATQVDNYIEGAKVTDAGATLRFERTHDSFKSDAAIVDRVRNFEFSESARYKAWKRSAATRHDAMRLGESGLGTKLLASEPEAREGAHRERPVRSDISRICSVAQGWRSCLRRR
jgi:nucleoside phosphorylase